jgi:hypothetical protein
MRPFGARCGESEIRITLVAMPGEFRIRHTSNLLKIQCGVSSCSRSAKGTLQWRAAQG